MRDIIECVYFSAFYFGGIECDKMPFYQSARTTNTILHLEGDF